MKCVIPGANIKVIARAIHSLAKVGEDLYLDPNEEGLAIRAANSGKSAFVSYFFKASFFSAYSPKTSIDINDSRSEINQSSQQYSQTHRNNIAADGDEEAKCRVTMKGIMTAFKSISQLEKTADTCLISVCHRLHNLKIRIICKYSVTKTYTVPFVESESLTANYDPNGLNSQFAARAKVLNDAVLNFLSNQEEVTMIVNQNQFSMKNYVEDDNGPRKIVHTQLTMQPSEFEDFKIAQDCNVTFSLKELRSLISFADALNLPVKATFNEGGKPIVFSVDSPFLFEGTLVMATLAEHRNTYSINTKESSASLNNSKADGHISTQESLNDTNRVQNTHKISENSNGIIENNLERNKAKDNSKRPFILSSRTEFNDTNLYASAKKAINSSENIQIINNEPVTENTNHLQDLEATNYRTPNQMNRLKIKTPPSKKAKYIFQRTFDATFKPSDVCGTDIVLASDSEGEEN